ncbi:zinc ABC transporter substrate-binding protein [Rhizobium sp. KVB221]|uniref:High-affinity zinc uptake system protein ZnuA n=2 Tax=Rhizobium setariae TaxID=2801340 RepID=A0A936YQW5_9HYPH|nr:zinc ABC transporter substrate-binding protein [Rhizobium setariae]
MLKTLFATALLAAAQTAAAYAAPDVIVSIKPIHSLVASIMKGVGEPGLIVDGVASPHTYQMKPSDAGRLQGADIVFWVGHDLEKFLEKPLESLGSKAKIVELDDAPGLVKLPTRESGTFEPHADEDHATGGHEADAHDHGEEVDLHFWLSTTNAKAIAAEIEKALIDIDPGNTQHYAKNLENLNNSLDALATEIAGTIAPVKDKPFIVFHDAYQYFEKEFGVAVAGSITVSPEAMPGAARISEIHDKVKALKTTCVFAEPQFEPKLIAVVLEGTDAKTGTLDPEAGSLKAGEGLYGEMMLGIAKSLRDCLETS